MDRGHANGRCKLVRLIRLFLVALGLVAKSSYVVPHNLHFLKPFHGFTINLKEAAK
jgi:hypothetical protein